MDSRKKLRSSLVAGFLAMALVVTGCSSSTDPDTWEDAEANGDKVRLNFLASCQEANSGAGSDADVPSYCECSYDELREWYSDDFQAFRDAESELRDDPEAINNPSIIPRGVSDALDACALQHL